MAGGVVMIASSLVLAFAGVDIGAWMVHRYLPPRQRFAASIVATVVWVSLVALLAVFTGAPLFVVPLIVVVGLLWAPLTSWWPVTTVLFLGIVAACALVFPVSRMVIVVTSGDRGSWVRPDGDVIVAVIAVVLFLGLSANLICRSALDDARRREHTGAHVRDRRLRSVLEQRWSAPARRDNELRGGRLIGPLERWLIAALALIGAQGIVAALMAAKGIVRFPEISKNSGEGSKAEEFLIGSLVSWGLAGAGAALVWTTL